MTPTRGKAYKIGRVPSRRTIRVVPKVKNRLTASAPEAHNRTGLHSFVDHHPILARKARSVEDVRYCPTCPILPGESPATVLDLLPGHMDWSRSGQTVEDRAGSTHRFRLNDTLSYADPFPSLSQVNKSPIEIGNSSQGQWRVPACTPTSQPDQSPIARSRPSHDPRGK